MLSQVPLAIQPVQPTLIIIPSQELNDIEGEAKACHFLGYAHYCLGNYKEAIRYYDQVLLMLLLMHSQLELLIHIMLPLLDHFTLSPRTLP